MSCLNEVGVRLEVPFNSAYCLYYLLEITTTWLRFVPPPFVTQAQTRGIITCTGKRRQAKNDTVTRASHRKRHLLWAHIKYGDTFFVQKCNCVLPRFDKGEREKEHHDD